MFFEQEVAFQQLWTKIMQWQDVRNHYPEQWILFEAIKAHTEDEKRIVDQIAVINSFPDSNSALKSYVKLHHESPSRELYVFHTSRESLDITVRRWLGIRGVK